MRLAGVDQGVRDALDAEPALRAACGRLAERGLAPVWVVTHVVADDDGAHVAYTLDLPAAASSDADLAALVAAAFEPSSPVASGPHHHHPLPGAASVVVGEATLGDAAGVAGARAALAAHDAGTSGRAVVYPGVDALVGAIDVGRVVATSAVDEVVSLGGPFGPDTVLQTRDHVRPQRRGDRWVLAVQPAAGNTLVPFENPSPKRCCADK